MTTPTDTASTARRQVDLDTLGTVAEQVGEFELAIARMANDPAMDVGQAPELLGRAGNRLADVREIPRKARRDVIEGVRGNSRSVSTERARGTGRVGQTEVFSVMLKTRDSTPAVEIKLDDGPQ